jgi:hypothetical protein
VNALTGIYLFQQVIVNFTTNWFSLVVELDFNVFPLKSLTSEKDNYKSAAVVISQRFCVSKTFEQGIRFEEDIFHSEDRLWAHHLPVYFLSRTTNSGDVLHNSFTCFRFSLLY